MWHTIVFFAPFIALDTIFLSAQAIKIPHGAWLPLLLGIIIVTIMATWVKGSQIIAEKTRKDAIPFTSLLQNLNAHPVHKTNGTAIFLTSEPDYAPVALTHNLKHNKVLHEHIALLKIETQEKPRIDDDDRIEITEIANNVHKIIVKYGFMESPNLPKALTLCRKKGLRFDIMSTSFFLGHRTIIASANYGMPLWQDHLFIFLAKNAINATDFFRIPSGRVVELGSQVIV